MLIKKTGARRRRDARLKGELLVGLDHLELHLLDLGGEDDLGGCGRVNAVGLDRDDDVAVVLQEVVRVEADDTGLVRLGDVGEAASGTRSVGWSVGGIGGTNMTSTIDMSMRYLLGWRASSMMATAGTTGQRQVAGESKIGRAHV